MSGSSLIALIHRTALALALGLLPSIARASEPAPSDPVFTVHLIDGKTLSGQLRQLGPNDRLTLVPSDGPDRVMPLDQVVKIIRDGPPVVFSTELPVVLLPDGERVFKPVVGKTKDMAIEVRHYVLGDLSIPLDSLVGLVYDSRPAAEPEGADLFLDRVALYLCASEVLWLANGDRLAGNFLGFDDTKIRFQTDNGTLSLDLSGIALGIDPALITYPRPQGTYLDLTLSDGSRVGMHHVRVEQGQIAATTRFGAEVRFALNELLAAHVLSDRLAYLAERPVVREQSIAYVGPSRSYQRDRTVDGHLFQLGGRTFDRGLGTASRSFLAYRLQPGDQCFQALVGLDDRAGALGNVLFRVIVDGKERFASPPMSIRDTPRPVDVDVAGGNVLILVTDFGDRGGVRDFADWVEARWIRDERPASRDSLRATAAMQDHEPTDNAETLTDLGHLAAGVGHHVINAFSAIVSNAELLRLKSPHIPVADPTALAETIIHSALGAATVARRLIDYTRSVTSIDPGRGVFTPASIALDRLVAGFVEQARALGPAGIAWATDLASVPLIQGHERQLRAMLGHLTRNACEAMPTQHGAIALSTATDARGWVVLELRDSGEGMTHETLERAVEPFFSSRPGHQGVGLSIANGIWRRHRGTLSLRSQPGEGTVVRLCIEPIRA